MFENDQQQDKYIRQTNSIKLFMILQKLHASVNPQSKSKQAQAAQ